MKREGVCRRRKEGWKDGEKLAGKKVRSPGAYQWAATNARAHEAFWQAGCRTNIDIGLYSGLAIHFFHTIWYINSSPVCWPFDEPLHKNLRSYICSSQWRKLRTA